MFPNLGCAQETCQTGPSWLQDAVVSRGAGRGGGGGDIPSEGLEETVVVTVDFEDLNGLVGGAGLGDVSREGEAAEVGVDVRRGVCRSSPERSRAGRESVQRSDVCSTGKLTIMSSWRFDSCVYCWPCPSAVGNRYGLRESPWSCRGGRRTILKVREGGLMRGLMGWGVWVSGGV